MKLLLCCLMVMVVLALPGQAEEAEKKVKVLFLGNSYTAQVRGQMNALLKASALKGSTFEYVTSGGCTLTRHLSSEAVVKKIRGGGWDYVVLQEQSQTPGLPGLKQQFLKSAVALSKIIKDSGATPVFYMTWGHRDGDKKNQQSYADYKSMQDKLTASYVEAAKANDALLVPVGKIWSAVRDELKDDYGALYKGDGRHPSGKGAFLVACSFFRFLFQSDLAFVEPKDEQEKLIKKAVLEHTEVD